MTANGWLQIIMYFLLVLAVTVPLGAHMFRVFERRRTCLDPVLRPVSEGPTPSAASMRRGNSAVRGTR